MKDPGLKIGEPLKQKIGSLQEILDVKVSTLKSTKFLTRVNGICMSYKGDYCMSCSGQLPGMFPAQTQVFSGFQVLTIPQLMSTSCHIDPGLYQEFPGDVKAGPESILLTEFP